MQAVILSGGQGTRMRPLTATVPKPSVPLVNRPMISYMIDWVAHHGVDDVIMSVGFLADGLRAALDAAGHEGVRIRYVEEREPLGTAGAVKHAEGLLDDRFLVLNGDVLAEFDLTAELAQHERTGARATLALVPVEDATAYGVVLTGDDNAIEAFLEKPAPEDVPPDPRINAGAYVLERSVLDLIPAGENRSFEHDVFPRLVGDGIYAFDADGYWLDLGTPDRYMTATRDLLAGTIDSWLAERAAPGAGLVETGAEVDGAALEQPVVIGGGAMLGEGTKVGRFSVIGEGVRVGANCVLDGAVLMRGCEIGDGVTIDGSILGSGVRVGDNAKVIEGSVVGDGAHIGAGNVVSGESRVDAAVDIPAVAA